MNKNRERNGSFPGTGCRTDASTATQKDRRCKRFGMREKVIYTNISKEELNIKKEREKKRRFISIISLQTRSRDGVMEIVSREISDYQLHGQSGRIIKIKKVAKYFNFGELFNRYFNRYSI